MAGLPWLGKFESQSIVLTDAAAIADYAVNVGHRAWAYRLFFALPTAMAYVTAYSMARCWILVFSVRPRGARSQAPPRAHMALWGTLLVLTALVVIAGHATGIPELLRASIVESTAACDELKVMPSSKQGNPFSLFSQAWPSVDPSSRNQGEHAVESAAVATSPARESHERGRALNRAWLTWAWLAGIALAAAIYGKQGFITSRIIRLPPIRWMNSWLLNGMFFDELYDWTVINLGSHICWACGEIFNRKSKDGTKP
jgi:NADH:ubiquinone oxidoreductase subunit 5 (subunit L)/multisubunit Na+/H+ antiporter MnhA subunit